MKVRCLVWKVFHGGMICPGCGECSDGPLWLCIDCAPGATMSSFFHYEVSEYEQDKFGGIAEGKFVELNIEEIERTGVGIIRMAGAVSKFACDYNTRPYKVNAKLPNYKTICLGSKRP